MKPRFGVAKFLRLGNTYGVSAALSPNHEASVAAYCSTEVVGIHRPRALEPASASSGPLGTSDGNGVPFDVFIP